MRKIIFFSLIVIVVITIVIKNMGYFFDITQQPSRADLVVSLGGDDGSRLKKALSLYDSNLIASGKTILTGADNIDPIMKVKNNKWRQDYALKHDIPPSNIVLAPDTKNTLEEMRFIKHYMIDYHLSQVIVISDSPHSRRIAFLCNTVLDFPSSGLKLTVAGADNDWWNKETYYTNERARAFLINESIKYSYYYIQYLLGNLNE